MSLGAGILNSAIFNSFHNRVEFGTILEGLWNFGTPLLVKQKVLAESCYFIPFRKRKAQLSSDSKCSPD